MNEEETIILFRPIGTKELELIKESHFRKWPSRLEGQPIFYPVTNENYAKEIAEKWNAKYNGAGYVTRFKVRKTYLDKYTVKQVGASHHTEYWIPAEDLDELNENIVGEIEVIFEFP